MSLNKKKTTIITIYDQRNDFLRIIFDGRYICLGIHFYHIIHSYIMRGECVLDTHILYLRILFYYLAYEIVSIIYYIEKITLYNI